MPSSREIKLNVLNPSETQVRTWSVKGRLSCGERAIHATMTFDVCVLATSQDHARWFVTQWFQDSPNIEECTVEYVVIYDGPGVLQAKLYETPDVAS